MAQPLSILAGLLLAFLAALVMRRGVRQARLIERLQRIRPTPIDADTGDLQMVRGRIETELPLRSAFQGRSCAYYFFRVLEPREGRKPRLLASGKEWTTMKVRDESGSAEVEPVTPVVASPRRFETTLRELRTIPAGLESFFERAGIDEKHLPRLPTLTVHEYTLEPGDEVYVTGAVRKDAHGKRFVREGRTPLIVSAEPDVGYVQGLRRELLIYAALPPMLIVAAAVLLWVGVAT